MGALNLSILIQAVDRATAPLRGIMRAVRGLRSPAKIAGLAMLSLGRDIRNMAMMGGAAVTVLGAGLFRLVRGTANAGEAAMAASQKTGVAVRSYQRLAYAAEQAEASTESLDEGLKHLNLSIDAAGRGSKADARAFAQLGISIKDANGKVKPTETIFLEAADAMAKLENGSRKAAIAQAIFGRGGIELIPMLSEGADGLRALGDEAERAGLVMSEEAARQAGIFNDSLGALIGEMKGLGRTVTTNLLPDMIKLVGWLRQMIAANRPEIVRQLTAALASVKAVLPDVIKGVQGVFGFMSDLNRILAPVVKAVGGFAGVLDIVAGLMIGRVALAIWAATKAVLGLNVAMYANPIGLIIAGIAALVFAGWLLYRNWDMVVSGIRKAWSGLVSKLTEAWTGIKTAFKNGATAVWNALPWWFRQVLRGVKFAVEVASKVPSTALGRSDAPGLGQQIRDRQRATGMYGLKPAAALDAGGTIRLELVEGRATGVRATPNDSRMNFAVARGSHGR